MSENIYRRDQLSGMQRAAVDGLGGKKGVWVPAQTVRLVKGRASAAIVLAQLEFWAEGKVNDDGWFYLTVDRLKKRSGLSYAAQKTATKWLEKLGIIEVEVKGMPATRHFRINYTRMIELLLEDPSYRVKPQNSPQGEEGQDQGLNPKTSPGVKPQSMQKGLTPTNKPYKHEDKKEGAPSLEKANAQAHRIAAQSEQMATQDPQEIIDGFERPAWADGNGRSLTPPPRDALWLTWGGSKVRARGGIEADDLRRIGWMFEERRGFAPVDGEWSGWLKALATSYQVAGGDFKLIEEAFDVIDKREPMYRPKHPGGLPTAIREAIDNRDAKVTPSSQLFGSSDYLASRNVTRQRLAREAREAREREEAGA